MAFEPFLSDFSREQCLSLRVSGRGQGVRLDRFLSRFLPLFSRSELQDLIKKGDILVNGVQKRQSYRLHLDEQISLCLPHKQRFHEIGRNIPLQILYEDDWLTAINKPAGLPVHPVAGNLTGTVMNALAFHYHSLGRIPAPVHRLDRDVSGLLLIAKETGCATRMSRLFMEGRITKTYIALVRGRVSQPAGVISFPLEHQGSLRLTLKPAETAFRRLKVLGDCTFICFHPRTGRKHQIRRHAAMIGHPVLNDPRYGEKGDNPGRIWLHAAQMTFDHPVLNRLVSLSAPCPEEMRRFVKERLAAEQP